MFYQDGWVPLSDIAHEIDRRKRLQFEHMMEPVENKEAKRLLEWQSHVDIAFLIWDATERAEKIGVLLTNGIVTLASRRLVEGDGTGRYSNRHVHLFTGTVGSAQTESFEEEPEESDDLKLRYGPFLGLPILLPQSSWDEAAGKSSLENEASIAESRAGNVEVARRIIEMHDADKGLRKADFKEQLAPSWSDRRFDRAWATAAHERPDLSRPGRRAEGN